MPKIEYHKFGVHTWFQILDWKEQGRYPNDHHNISRLQSHKRCKIIRFFWCKRSWMPKRHLLCIKMSKPLWNSFFQATDPKRICWIHIQWHLLLQRLLKIFHQEWDFWHKFCNCLPSSNQNSFQAQLLRKSSKI